jgi:hypothetical protein
LNVFHYFKKFDSFLFSLKTDSDDIIKENEINNNKELNEKINTFIKCLCKIHVGHNIHQRIDNEISRKTNLYILKGDYFFSLGYYTVAQIGNPLLIKFYSKISENFARVKILKFIKYNYNIIFFLKLIFSQFFIGVRKILLAQIIVLYYILLQNLQVLYILDVVVLKNYMIPN